MKFDTLHIILLLFLPSMLSIASDEADEVKYISFYVSPNGNDANDGTNPDKAFASLTKARNTIRGLKSKGELQQAVNVCLLEGIYEISGSFVLTPEDSGTSSCPVSYHALENASVVFRSKVASFNHETNTEPVPPLILLQGDRRMGKFVQYINFSGIVFTDIDFESREDPSSSVIAFEYAKFCRFENNYLRNYKSNYGIRLDAGTANIQIKNNVFENAISGIYCGDANRQIHIENNFFINLKDHVLCIANPEGQDNVDFSFNKNIIYSKFSDQCIYKIDRPKSLPTLSDFNLFWNPYECFSQMTFLMFSDDVDAGFLTGIEGFFDWLNLGYDIHSIVWNPGFVDVSIGDYKLKANSPAFMIGIENIEQAQGCVQRLGLKTEN